MKFFTATASVSVLALTALTVAQVEDVLYSSKLKKRALDEQGHFNMSFFHVNDVHAHLDEFSSSGTDCTEPEEGCYGGYARIKHVIDTTRPKYNNSMWLNVGDEFQGTLYFTYYGGEKIAETLNQLNFTAMTLGNHEFDRGDEVLGDFLDNLTFPIIAANVHSENEKMKRIIKPYYLDYEKSVGVIGVTTDDTPNISNPDDTTTFDDVVKAVDDAVAEIKQTTNITNVVAITHIGYEKDIELAQKTSGLHLIMGGHSHTLLGDMEDAEGEYPTIVQNKDDKEVFVVTAYRWGEYVGYIDVVFDGLGEILSYHGAPIHITNTTEQDAALQAQIEEWAAPFKEFSEEVMGASNVELDQTTCQEQECLLGDFMADAMLSYRREITDTVDFALINAGGIRATIDEGNITRGEVLTSFPFGNSLVDIQVNGSYLWGVLEGIVTGVNFYNGEEVTSFFQISQGIKVEYNPENANFSKLVSVTIGNSSLDNSTEYTLVTLDFLAGGGDNFFLPVSDLAALQTQEEVLIDYIEAQSPVEIELDGRIAVVNGSAQPSPRPSGSQPGSPSGTAAPQPSDSGNAAAESSFPGVMGTGAFALLAGIFFF
ncbi:Metallo-dependent phosphatase [Lojkania enalia]|uniref:Metallo-dependent phosphatase n=1 Tax=Lojkania enalia TaxID=147567 RepID=A0A9P4TQR4_9PLEO|nr:Metallo-dependent phosphatase [Didymosphaeria enalia]